MIRRAALNRLGDRGRGLAAGLCLAVLALVVPEGAAAHPMRAWQDQAATDRSALRSCLTRTELPCALPVSERLVRALRKAGSLDAADRIAFVNALVNRVPYRDKRDETQWRGPAEVLARGGDCLEVALTKAVLLDLLSGPGDVAAIDVVAGRYRLPDAGRAVRPGSDDHALVRVTLPDGSRLALDLNANVQPWGKAETSPLAHYWTVRLSGPCTPDAPCPD